MTRSCDLPDAIAAFASLVDRDRSSILDLHHAGCEMLKVAYISHRLAAAANDLKSLPTFIDFVFCYVGRGKRNRPLISSLRQQWNQLNATACYQARS